MRRITTLRVYNLVNAKGNRLRLNLGFIDGSIDEPLVDDHDRGWRWRFEGRNIPMPVRSGYWFNGFPESVMLDWLKGNGWSLRTVVNMVTGAATVYELPNGDEADCKGNEEVDSRAYDALVHAVRLLWNDDSKRKAVTLYKQMMGCTICEAKDAVREIIDQQI